MPSSGFHCYAKHFQIISIVLLNSPARESGLSSFVIVLLSTHELLSSSGVFRGIRGRTSFPPPFPKPTPSQSCRVRYDLSPLPRISRGTPRSCHLNPFVESHVFSVPLSPPQPFFCLMSFHLFRARTYYHFCIPCMTSI